ncbi:MAG: radical SAM protein [Spirochaetales bacterium]|nr:radical SAM protein [Spirochaetales bacterium]
MKKSIEEQLKNHPCFNAGACSDHARIHLPVAPKCNVQCGFCNRKYDCVNESRPGVTSSVLTPGQAKYYLDQAMDKRYFDVVGIAGPGDPFANPEETMETLRLIRENYPKVMLCVATNGVNIGPYIDELAELEVSHVTLTINGVDPEVAGNCYRWIRHNKRVYRGKAAGEVLVREQLAAVKRLVEKGILVKINSVVIPGVNDFHIPEVAKTVGELGVVTHNCLGLIPVEGTDFEDLEEPDIVQIAALRKECEQYVPQMGHCRRCRADAAGLLEEAMSEGTTALLKDAASKPANPDEYRPYIAVATMEGMLINQHLGHSKTLCIYKENEKTRTWEYLEERIMPPAGGGDERWERIAETLKDCSALLTSGIGGKPEQYLNKKGVKVYQIEGMISSALDGISRGEDLRHMAIRTGSCSGTGEGCA